jgi:hypothetical protein
MERVRDQNQTQSQMRGQEVRIQERGDERDWTADSQRAYETMPMPIGED